MKKDLMVKNYEDCLFNDKIILKSQQAFRSDHHDLYTVEINKTALSGNDDKRLQAFDKIATYPYRTNAFKVNESEMMTMRDLFVENYVDCSFDDEVILQPQQR